MRLGYDPSATHPTPFLGVDTNPVYVRAADCPHKTLAIQAAAACELPGSPFEWGQRTDGEAEISLSFLEFIGYGYVESSPQKALPGDIRLPCVDFILSGRNEAHLSRHEAAGALFVEP